MNRRTVGIVMGLLILVVALIVGVKGRFGAGDDASQAQPTEAISRTGSSSGIRATELGRSRRPSAANRSSGVAADQVENEIKRLLSDNKITNRQASEKLLAMAADPLISNDMRADSLDHALNLVEDAEYAELVLPYLQENLFEDPAMQRVALDNAYNRNDLAKLPAALALFRQTDGELQAEARELMAFILDQDAHALGDDAEAWSRAITEHLNKVPEE